MAKKHKRPTRQRSTPVEQAPHLKKLSPLGHGQIRDREYIWAWLHLYLEGNQFDPENCGCSLMIDDVNLYLSNNTHQQIRVRSRMHNRLLPDEDFEWITADRRQLNWLLPLVEDMTYVQIPSAALHLRGRDRLLAMVDAWAEPLETKAENLKRLADLWKHQTLQDAKFAWFMDVKEGDSRCACAWEWLKKNHLARTIGQSPISNYLELLQYFDTARYTNFEQKATIQEIKKRWSRVQFGKRNSDKKQLNLLLPQTVIAEIDRLAKERNLKRVELIEQLVRQAADSASS